MTWLYQDEKSVSKERFLSCGIKYYGVIAAVAAEILEIPVQRVVLISAFQTPTKKLRGHLSMLDDLL